MKHSSITRKAQSLAEHATGVVPDLSQLSVLKALPEYQLLANGEMHDSPEAINGGTQHVELDRTMCSVYCLGYLYRGQMADYQALTEPQAAATRLTQAEFKSCHQWLQRCLPDQDSYNLMHYIMLIHDIGKNQAVARQVAGESAGTVDHDEVLMRLFGEEYSEQRAQILPTFDRLPAAARDTVRQVLSQPFNLGQYVQAEAPAAIVSGLTIREPVRSLHLLHTVLDIAGAAGHVHQTGSIVLTSTTYQQLKVAMESLTKPEGSFIDRYNDNLRKRAQLLGVEKETIEQLQEDYDVWAQVRLACMLRYNTPEQFQTVAEAYQQLPDPVQAVLARELSKNGINDRSTMLYYAPALLAGLTKHHGMEQSIAFFAHLLQEAHIADKPARQQGETGVVLADISILAQAATAGQLDPARTEVRFDWHDNTLVPRLRRRLESTNKSKDPDSIQILEQLANDQVPEVRTDELPAFDGESLRDKRVIYVGMGGGSDGLQAALLGRLHQQHYGVKPMALVSVRANNKPVTGAGDRLSDQMYQITDQTRAVGDWRFLEGIVAQDEQWPAPVYLLNTMEPTEVTANLQQLTKQTGAQAIVGIDTGGDVLYRTIVGTDQVDTTPDQDFAVLAGLTQLAQADDAGDIEVYTAVVAPGIDTPDYANEVLDQAGAQRSDILLDNRQLVMDIYRDWRMDGSASEEGLYGKTPLALLVGLAGKTALQPLLLPCANAVSDSNPWRIFSWIQPSTSSVVMMRSEDLYAAVQESA